MILGGGIKNSLNVHDIRIKGDTTTSNLNISNTSFDIVNTTGEIQFDTSGGIEIANSINLNGNEVQNAGTINSSNNITLTSTGTALTNIGFITNGSNRLLVGLNTGSSRIRFFDNPATTTNLQQTTVNQLMTMNNFMSIDLNSFEPYIVSAGGGTPTYNSGNTSCKYVKFGRMVYMSYFVVMSGKGTLANGIMSFKLPFTAVSTCNQSSLTIGLINNLTGTLTSVDFYVNIFAGTDTFQVFIKGDPSIAQTVALRVQDVGNFQLNVSGYYFTTT